ncbi:cytochrome c assembly protein [Pyrolobus fumarii 1A]|uniref:Cytochrome c assembly protein n=1 Tax=Pyrolobus fumarii (strain DSM 11204 / 1A) TaxID=694429 RepID=G0EG21_PYRF1|nr:cytochrome c biogenesis protein CcsA [Pyrolobus fumarii]AEM38269.1 cytochrome c assembly protein [Pyrolobus fumarii 1A]
MSDFVGYHYTIIPAVALLALLAYSSLEALRGRLAKSKKMLMLSALLAIAAWVVYTIPFVTRDYSLKPVYESTSEALPEWLLPATAWSTGGGSLYLYAVIAAIGAYLVARSVENNRVYLAVAPWLSGVALIAAILYGAFDLNPNPQLTGMGLNPLLKSFWIYPHPLTTFGGYALLAVSTFALALGLRSRSITVVYEIGWAMLTLGIMLGGLWSYETFGWGGYWAWDPVETAELMVWLAATTVPHVMVALPSLAPGVAALTTSTVYLAMYVTRTGLSPLHSFAAPGIASLTLISVSMALLVLSLYLLVKAEGVAREVRKWVRTPFNLGMGIATIALLLATLFVTSSLLMPSIFTAVGQRATAPTMDSGIRFYHPVLYPVALALLTGIAIAFIGDRLGWRGIASLMASVALAAVLLAYRVASGGLTLAPLSPQATNIMMVVGIVFAATTIVSTLVFIALRIRDSLKSGARIPTDHYLGIALIHLGFALVLLGVFLGGTYSYNQAYFESYTLKPGDSIQLPGGKLLVFEGYEYGVIEEPVDIFTPYAGRSSTYFLAQDALLTLHFDVASLYKSYMEGKRLWNSDPRVLLVRSLEDKTFHMNGSIVLCPEGCSATISYRDIVNNITSTLSSDNTSIVLENVTLSFAIEPWTTRGAVVGTVVAVYVNSSNATLYAKGVAKDLQLGSHMFYLVMFDKSVNITVQGVGVLEVRGIGFYVTPESLRKKEARIVGNDTLVLGPVIGFVADGTLYANGIRVNVGLAKTLPASIAYYILVNSNERLKSLIEAIANSTLASILTNSSIILRAANYTGCETYHPLVYQMSHNVFIHLRGGCIDAPRFVPATAYVKLKFAIVDPESGARLEVPAILRFEVNGEIQGIHGLVSEVLHAPLGVTDVYIAVHPPSVQSDVSFLLPMGQLYTPVFHDLAVYYLHEAFKVIKDPVKRLALAALIASGLQLDNARRMDPNLRGVILEADAIALYLLAEKYSVDKSPLVTEGVVVEVKLVPGAILVWSGSIVMALAAVIAAAARLAGGRVGRQ